MRQLLEVSKQIDFLKEKTVLYLQLIYDRNRELVKEIHSLKTENKKLKKTIRNLQKKL